MEKSIFDIFESNLLNPITFHWSSYCGKVTDVTYKGELITIEKHTGANVVALYTLTRNSLICSINSKHENPAKAASILYLRNPRLSKLEHLNTNLYYISYE